MPRAALQVKIRNLCWKQLQWSATLGQEVLLAAFPSGQEVKCIWICQEALPFQRSWAQESRILWRVLHTSLTSFHKLVLGSCRNCALNLMQSHDKARNSSMCVIVSLFQYCFIVSCSTFQHVSNVNHSKEKLAFSNNHATVHTNKHVQNNSCRCGSVASFNAELSSSMMGIYFLGSWWQIGSWFHQAFILSYLYCYKL